VRDKKKFENDHGSHNHGLTEKDHKKHKKEDNHWLFKSRSIYEDLKKEQPLESKILSLKMTKKGESEDLIMKEFDFETLEQCCFVSTFKVY
jgi:predicted transcriptional regulator